MQCTNCGQELRDGMVFCPFCGATLGEGKQVQYDFSVSTDEVRITQEQAEAAKEKAKKTTMGLIFAAVGLVVVISIVAIAWSVLKPSESVSKDNATEQVKADDSDVKDDKTSKKDSKDSSKSSDDGRSQEDVAQETYVIGMLQYMSHDSLDNASEGFMDALTDMLGDNVVFDLQNAEGSEDKCDAIIEQFMGDDVDLIMTNGVTALLHAADLTDEMPIIATCVDYYATDLGLSDWNGATGINVSGTTVVFSMEDQEGMIVDFLPDTTKVAIVTYLEYYPEIEYEMQMFEECLEADDIDYTEFVADDVDDIEELVFEAAYSDKYDAIYIPIQVIESLTSDVLTEIIEDCVDIPLFTDGCFVYDDMLIAELEVDTYAMGYQTGLMAYEVLVNGRNISRMEVEYPMSVNKYCYIELVEAAGLEVPEDYEEFDE